MCMNNVALWDNFRLLHWDYHMDGYISYHVGYLSITLSVTPVDYSTCFRTEPSSVPDGVVYMVGVIDE